MTVAWNYVMHAADAAESALETALQQLADTVRAVTGCSGVSVMRDVDDERRFVFVETWESIEAHELGAKTIPKDAFAAVMAAVGSPPETSRLKCL